MLTVHPLENLKVYISSRPPLVVFMISVSAMAIAFLTLGYFFKIKQIKSPEMTEVSFLFYSLIYWLEVNLIKKAPAMFNFYKIATNNS